MRTRPGSPPTGPYGSSTAIAERSAATFTHVGLVPDYECFDVCTNAWGGYITGSLKSLITTGTGNPNNDTRNAEALSQLA